MTYFTLWYTSVVVSGCNRLLEFHRNHRNIFGSCIKYRIQSLLLNIVIISNLKNSWLRISILRYDGQIKLKIRLATILILFSIIVFQNSPFLVKWIILKYFNYMYKEYQKHPVYILSKFHTILKSTTISPRRTSLLVHLLLLNTTNETFNLNNSVKLQ